MEHRINEVLNAFERHLARIDELTHTILKGHLLVEEALTKALYAAFPNSSHLNRGSFRFFQKIQLLRAISKFPDDSLWEMILALNSLRNEVAHSLDSPKLNDKVADVRASYFKAAAGYEGIDAQRSQPDDMICLLHTSLAVKKSR